MLFYLIPAAFVFAIAVSAFFQDDEVLKSDLGHWAFILLASLLWPLTLPSILIKQYQKLTTSLRPANAN